MTTEAEVYRAMRSTTEAVAIACGTTLGGKPEMVRHIAMMGAVTWLMNQAAMSAFLAFTGEQVRPGDPRVSALITDWLDALKLYPDEPAVAAAMNAARDKAFPDA